MLVIGLTGGIGTGKTEVAMILNNLGLAVINVDEIGHESYINGSPAWYEILKTFGKQVLTDKGEIDREKLSRIVFQDDLALERLNSIVHPKVFFELKKRLNTFETQERLAVVVEAALLLEVGWASLVNEVWVTVAKKQHVLSRLRYRNNLDAREVQSRIEAQMPQEERVHFADILIENDGGIEDLRGKVKAIWEKRVATTDKDSI